MNNSIIPDVHPFYNNNLNYNYDISGNDNYQPVNLYANLINQEMPFVIYKKTYNKFNIVNKKLKLPKRILDYLDIKKTEYSIEDLKNAIIEKSENNKKQINFKNSYPKTTIYLDKKGKEILNVRGNYILIDCLIDILLEEHSLEIPNYDYYDFNQIPIEVKHINLKI